MGDLLYSLLGGIIVIALVFLLIKKVSRLSGKSTAIVMALIVVGLYVPYSILFWKGGDVFAIHIAMYLVTVYVMGIITSARDSNGKGNAFHWAPALIILFFMVVIGVDSVFITLAQRGVSPQLAEWILPRADTSDKVSSYFQGTVKHNYHQKKGQYNAYIAQMEEQKKRGWIIKKGWVDDPIVNQPAIFKVSVFDKENKPIEQARLEGIFMRPGNVKKDISFSMKEVGNGDYQVSTVMTEPGEWRLILNIHKDGFVHEVKAKTTIKPEIDNTDTQSKIQ
jgi:nitrogen fixation protein FixH